MIFARNFIRIDRGTILKSIHIYYDFNCTRCKSHARCLSSMTRSSRLREGIIRQQGIVIWIALQQVPGIESTRAPDEVQLTCSLHTRALLPRPCSSFSISPHVSPPPPSSNFCFFSSCPLEKARFVSPQRALLQVPDWLLNWHSLKYPSNACRERYVWMKESSSRSHTAAQNLVRDLHDPVIGAAKDSCSSLLLPDWFSYKRWSHDVEANKRTRYSLIRYRKVSSCNTWNNVGLCFLPRSIIYPILCRMSDFAQTRQLNNNKRCERNDSRIRMRLIAREFAFLSLFFFFCSLKENSLVRSRIFQ